VTAPAPADRIGRYPVQQVIGTGAFATVYRALDERLDAVVAVKLLADNHCLDPDIRARFIDEGRALRRIDSPHVVRVYDVGETERMQPYLVLELADRGTLAQRVTALRAAGWRPGPGDVRALAADLAAAATAVHAAGLVHRDLSPGNILLRSGVTPTTTGPGGGAPGPTPIAGAARPGAPGPAGAGAVSPATTPTTLAAGPGIAARGPTPIAGAAGPGAPTPAPNVAGTAAGASGAGAMPLAAGPGPGRGAANGQAAGPSSALVRVDERLVVADLGLSKDLARSSGLTAAGGTDGFRPPEQRGGPGRVDARADLWALSAVLFWLLTGRPPDPENPEADLDRALTELGLPPALDRPLLAGLDEDPTRRPADAGSWWAAVEAALTPPAPPVPVLRPPPPAPGGRAVGWTRRRLAAVVALVVASGLAGAAAATVAGNSGGDDGNGGQVVTRQADGQVEVTDRAGDASLALTGPARAEVGATVTFEAHAEGVDHWAWLMPDGTVYADRASVQIRSRSAGVAPVSLVAVADSGERLEVDHDLRLTGP
jgi:serine/threonine protein kinase